MKTTTLAALHDLNLAARYCDRLVMLGAGRLVAKKKKKTTPRPPAARS